LKFGVTIIRTRCGQPDVVFPEMPDNVDGEDDDCDLLQETTMGSDSA